MSIPKGFGTVVFLFKTTQAAAESAKVDYSVHSVRRGNLMKYTMLYQAACYVHSTQAAQKVPETKKVDDGVHPCVEET